MSTGTNELAALLCRVSTKDQEDGYSLEAQERLLREYCDRRGFSVVLVWSFSETASKYEQRKKFKEFVTEVHRTKVSHIIAEKVDRVSRAGSRDAVLIEEWLEDDITRHLHLAKQSLDIHKHAPSTMKFVWNMHLAVAKHYSDNLSEEVTKAANVMLNRGIWPTATPIGYVRVKGHSTSPIQSDPVVAPMIKELFELYASGDWSGTRLKYLMDQRGLRNSRGRCLSKTRIYVILQDGFYVGRMTYRGQVWQGVHEPLITPELFELVQRRIKRRLKGTGAIMYRKHDHLLRGLCTCAQCDQILTWEIHRMKTYGNCKRRAICSERPFRLESQIEEAALNLLSRLVVKNKAVSEIIYRSLQRHDQVLEVDSRQSRTNIVDLLSKLEKKQERLIDMRLADELSKDQFESRRSEIQNEIALLQNELESSSQKLECYESPSQLFAKAQSFHSKYLTGVPDTRRQILKQVFSKIIVGKSSIHCVLHPQYQKLLKSVEKTNRSKTSETVILLD